MVGRDGRDGLPGRDGINGKDGKRGKNGLDGKNCEERNWKECAWKKLNDGRLSGVIKVVYVTIWQASVACRWLDISQ